MKLISSIDTYHTHMKKSEILLGKIIESIDSDPHFIRGHKADIIMYAKQYHKEQNGFLSWLKRTFSYDTVRIENVSNSKKQIR